jgi:hypothetical protein
MGHAWNVAGFIVVVILYAVIGGLAASGTIFIVRRVFAPKAEQIFYAMFLIMIAAFYLAFTAYFGASAAWRLEAGVVAVYAVIGALGVRLPFALIVGYSLHGAWDLLHELQAHGAYSGFEPGQLTAIPLAYGVFCASFDLCVAGYSYARRSQWIAAWRKSGDQDPSEVGGLEPALRSLLKSWTPVAADLPAKVRQRRTCFSSQTLGDA